MWSDGWGAKMRRLFAICVLLLPFLGIYVGKQFSADFADANPKPPYPHWNRPKFADANPEAEQLRTQWDREWKANYDWIEARANSYLLGFGPIYALGVVAGLIYVAYHRLRREDIGGYILLAAIPVYAIIGLMVFIGHQFRHG